MRIVTIIHETEFGPVLIELPDVLLTQDNRQACKTALIQFGAVVLDLRNLVLDLRDNLCGCIRDLSSGWKRRPE